jgi:ParB-like chromosome segregation protein Spo0J
MSWQNRIVETKDINPAELAPNPKNWRRHPKAQHVALSGVLGEVGVVQGVVFNKRTNRLIDGHLRVEVAIKNKEPTVPVTIVDLSEQEEDLILATFDPIGAMAEADADALEELVAGLPDESTWMTDVLKKLAGREPKVEGPEVKDVLRRTFMFTLDDEMAAEVDVAFEKARAKVQGKVSDDELFHALVTK